VETTIQLLPKNSSLGHPKTLCNSFNNHELCEIPKGLNATLVTPGMKVAVSIPNDLFDRVEQLRRQERRSRSNLFAVALAEYVARHGSDEVTESMNRVCAHVNTQPDNFVRIASRRVLERSEW